MDIARADIELPEHEDRAQDTGCAAADLFRAMATRRSGHLQAINCGPLTGMSARGARESMRLGAFAKKASNRALCSMPIYFAVKRNQW
jgi:hypothetical protein